MLLFHVFLVSFLCGGYTTIDNRSDNHDFHYSRCELVWNPTTFTWQGTTRVFTDDLQSALQKANGLEMNLNLGDQLEHLEAETWISSYFQAHCIGSISTPEINSLHWNYIGKEVDFDLTYLYFESQPLLPHDRIDLSVTLFFELFDDQVNEITFEAQESEMREWLTFEAPKTTFQWQP
jgi:hypothetical protein